MAIAVGASVARWAGSVSQGSSITSASFTPADGSLLVLCINMDKFASSSMLTVVFTVTGGSLVWTQRVIQQPSATVAGPVAAIWTAPVVTGASMTVSVSQTGDPDGGRLSAKLYIVTGQHALPIGATGSGTSATNNITPTAYTSTADNSRGFGSATDFNALGTPASTDTEDAAHYSGEISVLSLFKAADTPTSGTGVTMNFDASGTGAADWGWCALEILPDAAPAVGPVLFRPINTLIRR